MTDARELNKRAAELAESPPPLVVVENLFLGFFACLGWVIGRLVLLVYLVCLATADGFKHGATALVLKEKKPKAIVAPPAESNGHMPHPADLHNDDRLQDPYGTPFGVPYGPNVHASHE